MGLKCPSCGFEPEVDTEAVFCAHCGAKLIKEVEGQPDQSQNESHKETENTVTLATKSNIGSRKTYEIVVKAVILLILLGLVRSIADWYMKSQSNDAVEKPVLLSVAYDKYNELAKKNAEDASSLATLIGMYSPDLASFDSNNNLVLNMNQFKWFASKGKELLAKSGDTRTKLNKSLYQDYNNLLKLIQQQKWDSTEELFNKLLLANAIGVISIPDIKVLSAYVKAEKGFRDKEEDVILSMYLKEIPDNYSGSLASQILSRKKILAANSPSYQNDLEIERLTDELAILKNIKITDFHWHIDNGYAICNAKIKNETSKSISFVKVEVVYKDSMGNILDTDWTYGVDSHPLQPGYVKSFSIMTPATQGMHIASYRVVDYRLED